MTQAAKIAAGECFIFQKKDVGMKLVRILVLVTAVMWVTACQAQTPTENNDTVDYDYASGGPGFSVVLKGVGLQAKTPEIRPADDLGTPGYSYVIVPMIISNQSATPVLPASMVLIDQHMNEYISWQTNVPFGDELTPLPLAVEKDQTVEGQQVFIVPNSALSAGLHLRWQSVGHQSLMEIYLGELSPAGE
jgi:hypothetical protein